ncbi:MAG: hypothetical protein JNM93_06490 [Bacteriovoracaceae bacterium]|nr:hypothetical protein [Bacteriovoracaceae bacterium]
MSRFYKLKNPSSKFFCALCRAPREMYYQKNLSKKNIAQIAMISVLTVWLAFPLMGFKSLFLIFIIWGVFETTNKTLYRRELSCPHCAFDPTWYRKDVKVARQKVDQFFANKASGTVAPAQAPTVKKETITNQSLR